MNPIDKFLQEDLIGSFSQSPKLIVEVYSKDEGAIPHFHVHTKLSGGNSIDTCIEIGDNRYFRHGHHTDIISDGKVRKHLNKFLRSKPTQSSGYNYRTNWDWIVDIWNNNDNRVIKVSDDITIPDYSTIKLEIKNDPRLKNLKRKR